MQQKKNNGAGVGGEHLLGARRHVPVLSHAN
jgi:hypothetical protein